MAKKLTLPADPTWRPDSQQLQQFKDRFWRADKNQPWEDVNNAKKVTGAPKPNVGGCGGYAIFEWQSNETWTLVADHCIAPCTASSPDPSPSPMPVGMQVSVPC